LFSKLNTENSKFIRYKIAFKILQFWRWLQLHTPHHVSIVTFYHTLSHFVTLCHTLSLFVTLCHSLSLFVTLCHSLSLFVTLCHILSLFVALCYILLYFVIFCHSMVNLWHSLCHSLSKIVTYFWNSPVLINTEIAYEQFPVLSGKWALNKHQEVEMINIHWLNLTTLNLQRVWSLKLLISASEIMLIHLVLTSSKFYPSLFCAKVFCTASL